MERRRRKNKNKNENENCSKQQYWRDKDYRVFSKNDVVTRDDLFSCNVIRPHSKQIVALEMYDEIVRHIELRETIINKLLVVLNCEKFRNDPIGYTKTFSKYIRFGTLWKYVALVLERILSDQYMQFGDALYYYKDIDHIVSNMVFEGEEKQKEITSCLLCICNGMDTTGIPHEVIAKASSIYQTWKNKNNQIYNV